MNEIGKRPVFRALSHYLNYLLFLFHDHFHILVVPAIANVEKVHTRFELVKVQGLAVRFTAGFFGELNGLAEGIRQADRHVAGCKIL